MSAEFAVIVDDVFLKHDPGSFHPESPKRLFAILDAIKPLKLKDIIKVFPPDVAKKEEVLWNHTEELFNSVERSKESSPLVFDPDTIANEYTFEAALKAVGAQKTGLKLLFEEGYKGVFCLVRPPGHHAEKDRAMGFCFFNNVALAAHYAKKLYGLKRILIIDWDVHHGNGTQNAFYSDPEVLYFSTHQYPYYPGTGHYREIGTGEGRGYTLNIPLKAYCGDAEYVYVFEEFLKPVVLQYKPELIIVSAGYDCCKDDPLADMEVTPDNGIGMLTKIVRGLAEECCNGRVLFSLEGGYSLTNLKEAVVNTILVFLGDKKPNPPIFPESRIKKLEKEVLEPLRDLLSFKGYWIF
ncbi:MAG: histone deacetylase [Thermodesulfobacteria bacterium]|nr:histone deacetylase [Thermodesulfobacteriota bacterium]